MLEILVMCVNIGSIKLDKTTNLMFLFLFVIHRLWIFMHL